MLVFVVCFLVTAVSIAVLRRCAGRLGLTARPGGRRVHEQETPLVGGIGMYVGLTAGALFGAVPWLLLVCGLMVVIAGVWDDRHELSTIARFVAQIIAAVAVIYWGDVLLFDLGRLVSDEWPLYLGRWAVALTLVGFVGVMNAINMSDGMDGLAGSLSFVSAGAIVIASHWHDFQQVDVGLGVLLSVIGAFLMYNVRFSGGKPARVFMGDAGSMLLGFVLAWYLVKYSQSPQRVIAPVTALWIVALPLFDAVGALLRRIIKGYSPFRADRTHYHHVLLARGYSVNQALLISVSISVILAFVGLASAYAGIPEKYMFYAFLALFAAYAVGMEVACKRLGL